MTKRTMQASEEDQLMDGAGSRTVVGAAASEYGLFELALGPIDLDGGGRVAGHRLHGWIASGRDDLQALSAAGIAVQRPVPSGQPVALRREAPGTRLTRRAGLDDRPTVLLIHALTGDARAGGEDGWWAPLVGIGRPLDPRHYRILCFNNLGGCYGSSGPGDGDWPRLPDGSPQAVTTWDQARSLLMGLDALGIDRLHAVVGGSLGGMVALAVAALAPHRVERVVPIAACAAASAWIIGWNHVARGILALDGGPRGLELARQLAMLTYRAEPGLQQRQGRAQQGERRESIADWKIDAPYAVGRYLEHQGTKLRQRFESESYRLQLGAMDHHDLDRPPSAGTALTTEAASWGAARIRASAFVVSIDTDVLFTPAQSRELAGSLRAAGTRVEEATITSPHGHDAFLIEWSQLTTLLRRALAIPAGV